MSRSSMQVIRGTYNPAEDPLMNAAFPPTRKLKAYINGLQALLQGTHRGFSTIHRDTLCAAQTLVVSTGSGAVGATINGVTVTDTATGVDAADAALIAVAINASTNALVQYFVEADNRSATITLASCTAGTQVFICGITFTARAGTVQPGERGTFTIGGTDTADAASLVAAIKAHPAVSDKVWPIASAGVITIHSRRASTPALDLTLKGVATIAAASAAVLTSSAKVLVSAIRKGLPGNAITLAASGTGITATAARLAGGTTTVEAR